MRDIAVTIVFFATIPFVFAEPYIGILIWYIIAYGVPHHLAFGFAYDFPFAKIIGVVTLAAWLLSREPKRIPVSTNTILLSAIGGWMSLTMYFAINPDPELLRRTLIMIGVAILAQGIITTRRRLHLLVLVTALSLAFYGVKGGVFGILTGGSGHMHGPLDSPIEDNNHLAVHLIMILPLLWYLRGETQKRILRHLLFLAIVLTVICILVTYSRGGFIALSAVLLYGALKSRHKLVSVTVVAAVALSIVSFMPEQWSERMGSIGQYEKDASATGRLDAWRHAVNVATANPLIGGGFGTFTKPVFAEFTPGLHWRAAHSIYFECLGEQGFVGLGLFLALIGNAMLNARWAERRSRDRSDLSRFRHLGAALQASLIAYIVGGAFLSLTYYEILYEITMMAACLRLRTAEMLASESSALEVGRRAPHPRRPTPQLSPAE